MNIYLLCFEDYDRKFVKEAYLHPNVASREVARLNKEEPSVYADCDVPGWYFTKVKLK